MTQNEHMRLKSRQAMHRRNERPFITRMNVHLDLYTQAVGLIDSERVDSDNAWMLTHLYRSLKDPLQCIRHAMASTATTFGWRIRTPAIWLFLLLSGKLITWYFQGTEKAISDVLNWTYTIFGPGIALVILVFLWQLWLAPLRLAKIERCLAAQEREAGYQLMPKFDRADADEWGKYPVFKLHEAACLWVGIEPHYPIVDCEAKDAFYKLRHAIGLGQMGFVQTLEYIFNRFAEGLMQSPSTWRPTDTEKVTAIQLRKYADMIGEVPEFLKNVKIHDPATDPPDLEAQ